MASSTPRSVVYILFAGLVLQTSAQTLTATATSTQYQQELCTTVVLECVVTGTRTEIVWKFNQADLVLSSDSRYSNGNPIIPSLTINGVQANDNGTYQCIAKNGNIIATSANIVLTVVSSSGSSATGGQPPSNVVISPSSVLQNEGTSVTLTCTAQGDSTISYAWSRDNFATVQTGSSRTFSSLTRTDTAVYTCKARSCYGEALAQVFVNVRYTPSKPTVSPTTVTVTLGQAISINCAAEGNPTVSYSWYKGNSNTAISNGAVLQINSASASDDGTYTCRATNSVGSSTSNPVNVGVQYGPSTPPTVSTTSLTVANGQPISITCTAQGNPAVTIEWFKDGSNTVFQTGSPLSIPNASSDDTGSYRCRARNTFSSTQITVSVTVENPPGSITITPLSVNVTQGGSFTLTCNAAGNPTPTYEWYKNGVVIQNTGNVLTRNNVQYSETNGDYVCKATNTGGSTQKTANVNVQYKPTSSSTQPGPATVGNPVTLSCDTNANPPVTSYVWRYNGNTIAHTGKSYEIDMDTESDVGTYTCTVSNGIGTPTNIDFIIALESSQEPGTGAATASTGLTTGEIAAIVLAILFVLLLIIGLIICCCCTGYCAWVCGKKKDKVEPTKDKYYVEEPEVKVRTLEIPRFYEHAVEVSEPPTEVKKLRHKRPKMYRRSSDEFEISKYTVLKADDSKQLCITSREHATDNMYVTDKEMRDKENINITDNGTYERDNLYVSDSGTRERDNIYISDNGYRNYYLPELEYTYDYEEERRRKRRRKKKRSSRHHRHHTDDTSRDNEIIVEERIMNGDVLRSSIRSRRNDEDDRYVRSGRDDVEVVPGPEYYVEQ